MSLRLSALKGLIILEQLYASGWSDPKSERIWNCRSDASDAMAKLQISLGIAPLYPEHDSNLTPIGLLETIVEALTRDDETKFLASAVQAALAEHKRAALMATMQTAAE